MSGINLDEIRNLQQMATEKHRALQQQIQNLQHDLLAVEERIKVYDELLHHDEQKVAQQVLPEDTNERKRAPRSTKAEMTKRRQVVGKLLSQYGEMQPKELLPLVSEKLGYDMEAHHLRAVLRRFTDTFASSVHRHGYWSLTSQGESEFSELETL